MSGEPIDSGEISQQPGNKGRRDPLPPVPHRESSNPLENLAPTEYSQLMDDMEKSVGQHGYYFARFGHKLSPPLSPLPDKDFDMRVLILSTPLKRIVDRKRFQKRFQEGKEESIFVVITRDGIKGISFSPNEDGRREEVLKKSIKDNISFHKDRATDFTADPVIVDANRAIKGSSANEIQSQILRLLTDSKDGGFNGRYIGLPGFGSYDGNSYLLIEWNEHYALPVDEAQVVTAVEESRRATRSILSGKEQGISRVQRLSNLINGVPPQKV